MLRQLISVLNAELRAFGRDRARALYATMAAAAVVVAALLSFVLRLDNSWWAAIAAFRCVQASTGDSLTRGALRIVGTLIGAAVGFLVAPFVIFNQPLGCLFLFLAAATSVVGGILGRYSYAWILGGITAIMVVMSGIIAPLGTLNIAVHRAAETIIGVAAAALMAWLFGATGARSAQVMGTIRRPLSEERPVLLHGLRTGLAVAAMPLIWGWLDAPSVTQMAITATAVMITPIKPGEAADRRAVMVRAVHRLAGCALGGALGLLCLSLSIAELLPWLVMLFAGVWAGVHLERSERGVSYVGTQATVAFIMTLVQGFGPPASIMPGLDRIAGMVSGLLVLLLLSFLIWPTPSRDTSSSSDAPAEAIASGRGSDPPMPASTS